MPLLPPQSTNRATCESEHRYNCIDHVAAAVAQAKAIASGTLRSVKGHKLNIVPDTLCVHGDTPAAFDMLKAIRSALQTPVG